MVWNAHVMALPRWGQSHHLADLHKRLQDPQVSAPMIDAFSELSRRRAERFATDSRGVGEWSVTRDAHQWRLRCDARTPDSAA